MFFVPFFDFTIFEKMISLVFIFFGFSLCTNYFQHSGYFDVDSTKNNALFWWFFETNATAAPLILYLNGGPGCSSCLFSLYESGPLEVSSQGQVVPNVNSFSRFANLLYIDGPIGTGLSYATVLRSTEAEIADDFVTALDQFFVRFPAMSTADFYLFGESYAGKYIAHLGTKIAKTVSCNQKI